MNPTLDTINSIIVAVGIPSILAGTIYIGRKLQILDDLKITVDKIKVNLKVVTDFLTKNNPNFNSSELLAYSPLRLADQGLQLIQYLSFEEIFDEHKTDFYTYIDSEDPKVKYDVENAAIKSISVLGDKEYMQFLKIFFYNNPARNIQNTAPTLGIYIRDEYLKDHPHIIE